MKDQFHCLFSHFDAICCFLLDSISFRKLILSTIVVFLFRILFCCVVFFRWNSKTVQFIQNTLIYNCETGKSHLIEYNRIWLVNGRKRMKQSTNKVKITAYSFSMHLGKVINFKQMSVLFVVFAGVTFVCFFSVLLLFNAFFLFVYWPAC